MLAQAGTSLSCSQRLLWALMWGDQRVSEHTGERGGLPCVSALGSPEPSPQPTPTLPSLQALTCRCSNHRSRSRGRFLIAASGWMSGLRPCPAHSRPPSPCRRLGTQLLPTDSSFELRLPTPGFLTEPSLPSAPGQTETLVIFSIHRRSPRHFPLPAGPIAPSVHRCDQHVQRGAAALLGPSYLTFPGAILPAHVPKLKRRRSFCCPSPLAPCSPSRKLSRSPG